MNQQRHRIAGQHGPNLVRNHLVGSVRQPQSEVRLHLHEQQQDVLRADFRYEADGIVPFVANSPTRSFFYADPGNYKAHKNPEGALVPENRAWHEANRTYEFAYGLGTVIVLYGLLLCLNPWLPQVGAVGSFLVFVMSFVTLSFLITTPECWVPALGDAQHGFPYLSGAGRLVVKDAIMMGAALVTMADSAKAYLQKRVLSVSQSKVAAKEERQFTASVR